MSTQNNLYVNPSVPTISVFDAEGLVPSMVESLVPRMNPYFQRPVISELAQQLGGAQQIKAGNRLFNIYRQPNDFPSATIQTVTTSGSNLVLSFTNTQYTGIPVGHIIRSKSGCFAQVVVSNSGGMTIKFFTNPNGNTSFDTNVDFLATELVSDRGVVGNINNRTNPLTQFALPTRYENMIGTWEAGCEITHEDVNNKTFITTPYGNFYGLQKEIQTAQRMLQQYYSYMLDDFPMVQDTNYPVGSSLVNQIKTMGGVALPLSGAMTIQKLRDAAREFKKNGGFTSGEVVVVCGDQYFGDLAESLEPYVTTAGTSNVIGATTGINFKTYGFLDLTFRVVIDPYLSNGNIWGYDTEGFSNRSRSAIWMATDPVVTENGGTVPFVRDYYFGSTADVHRWENPGSMDSKGNPVKMSGSQKKSAQVNFTMDKTTQLMNPSACLTHGI
jgi:hypothetical protein